MPLVPVMGSFFGPVKGPGSKSHARQVSRVLGHSFHLPISWSWFTDQVRVPGFESQFPPLRCVPWSWVTCLT